MSHLGMDTFLRIKVGVGEKPKGYDLADYVLGHFSQAERRTMDESCKNSADAIKYMLKGSTDEAMNLYNIKVK